MNLDKNDVERIVENILNDLSIEVQYGGNLHPNTRTIILKYKNNIISESEFDVI